MHTNQQSLITILQVLLYDPLYNWTLSPSKANQLQQLKESKSNLVSPHEDSCDGVADNEPGEWHVLHWLLMRHHLSSWRWHTQVNEDGPYSYHVVALGEQ